MPEDYFPTNDKVKAKGFNRLRTMAVDLGYFSLFELAIAEASRCPQEARNFVESNALTRMYTAFTSHISKECTPQFQAGIADTVGQLIRAEWTQLMKDKSGTLKIPLNQFSPETVRSFSFEGLYSTIKSYAPIWVSLLDSLIIKDIEVKEADHQAQQWRIVVTTCVLGNRRSRE